MSALPTSSNIECPACGVAGELHREVKETAPEHEPSEWFYVCAVCSGAYDEDEVTQDGI